MDAHAMHLAEIDILCDLSEVEMTAIAAAAPMATHPAGALLYAPHNPIETLFILKRGQVRIFRLSPDGRALTTAIVQPGTIFGEMVLLGQHMDDAYAEALDEALVCVMTRADVMKHLMSDARIAARIAAILGRRLADMEQRLSDTVFKSLHQRVATTLLALSEGRAATSPLPGRRSVAVTHEQLAALVDGSRERVTRALGDFASDGLVRLGRGRVTILDRAGLTLRATVS